MFISIYPFFHVINLKFYVLKQNSLKFTVTTCLHQLIPTFFFRDPRVTLI